MYKLAALFVACALFTPVSGQAAPLVPGKSASVSAKPAAVAAKSARSASPGGSIDAVLGQLAMLQMGNRGNTAAHLFMEKQALYSASTAQSALFGIRGAYRKFEAPTKDGSIIVMFGDKSGVYIHSDGFVTPMGDDISGEVGAYKEMK